jgi:hypothetical protein
MFPGALFTRKIKQVSNESASEKAPRKEKRNTLYGAEPFLRSRQLRSYPRTSEHVMEPEGL